MPDPASDTAIDFYASAFCRELLDTANTTRFSKERITYGNDIFGGFRSHIWPANTLGEIADGGRLVGGSRIPLTRLDEGSRPYGRMLDNMLRPFGRRGCKDHYLATYPDERPVAFTVLDFDRHPPKRGPSGPPSTEDDAWLSIDEMFWHRVSTFHELATRLDLDVMWIQSPGRWLIDGHHLPCRMSGLYALIRHEPRTPSELRRTLAALKGRVGLDVETSWDTRNRNIRIPGQCFMDPCRVDPIRRSIAPIRDADASGERERNMARLAATVEGYEGLRPDGGERLLGVGARLLRIHSKGGTPPEAAGEGLVTSPIRSSAAVKKCGSRPVRTPHAASGITDTARWLREPDTFRVLHDSGLLYRVLREFGWDVSRAGEAVEWAAPRLRRLRPASSATCSDDNTLAAFIRKHYLWGCKAYDPVQAKASTRLKARIADEARIAPSLRLADKALDAYLKHVVGLSTRGMKHVIAFRRLERAYAGRVACGVLYATFGSQRRFMGFQKRHRLLSIAQEHSQSQGRCRQWSLSSKVIRSVQMLMASPVLLFMLCGGGGRRVTYIQTHSYSRPLFIRTPSFGACRSYGNPPVSPTSGLPVRGPPPQATKTRPKAMFGISDRATDARRRSRRLSRA